jgi:hypothetical protein
VTHQLVNNVSRALVATTAAAEKQNNSSQPLVTAGRVGSSLGWAAGGRPLAAAVVGPTTAGPAAAVQVGIFQKSSDEFSGFRFVFNELRTRNWIRTAVGSNRGIFQKSSGEFSGAFFQCVADPESDSIH